jgi:endonuclease YncB( thermonuclease family)
VLLAGCGSPTVDTAQPQIDTAGPATSAAGGPALNGPALNGPHLPAGSEPVAGNRVNTSELPAGFPREVWTVGDGHTIGFYGEAGSCQTVSAQPMTQTAAQVTIRLVQIQQPQTGHQASCAKATLQPMTVTLAQPLGSRSVLLQLSTEQG